MQTLHTMTVLCNKELEDVATSSAARKKAKMAQRDLSALPEKCTQFVAFPTLSYHSMTVEWYKQLEGNLMELNFSSSL